MAPKKTDDERRKYSRIPFEGKVLLTNESGGCWHSILQDLSLKGALIERPDDWDGDPGEHFTLEILFVDSGALIKMDACVAHTTRKRAGFRIINIDLESVTHLKRLMELNLGDNDLLHRELLSLG